MIWWETRFSKAVIEMHTKRPSVPLHWALSTMKTVCTTRQVRRDVFRCFPATYPSLHNDFSGMIEYLPKIRLVRSRFACLLSITQRILLIQFVCYVHYLPGNYMLFVFFKWGRSWFQKWNRVVHLTLNTTHQLHT